jgi:diguanylate cyclase (GGDEF)-like protein
MIYTKDLLKFSKKLNILYVEDDETLQEATMMVLGNLFGSVDLAKDGLEGLELYKEKKEFYDILITDIQMPKMDGIEMVENIKEIDFNQSIVVTSAHNESNLLVELISLNVDGFALKPIDTDKFIATLYKVSKSIHQQKEIQTYKDSLEKMVENKIEALQNIVENLEYEIKDKNLKIDSLNNILKEQIYIDQLTGIFNNKRLDLDIKERENISKDSDNSFSLILLDIDKFHEINDKINRKEANKIIQEFSILISKNLEEEAFYRYAGVEFVILSEDSKDNIDKKMYHIKEIVSEYEFLNNIKLNMTYGVADYNQEREQCLLDVAAEELKKYKDR